MVGVAKQIIGCLVLATLVAMACYFLPVVNGLFGDYLFGFYLAAFVLPLGMKWYDSRMSKAEATPVVDREKKHKEWLQKNSGSSTGSNCYDQRNIDRQLHIFDGFKN